MLMPLFALFFAVDIAVAMTAVVHFLNNLFKLVLLGKYADVKIVIRFGIPALLSALAGATLLLWLSGLKPIIRYRMFHYEFGVEPVKMIIASLMLIFALFELVPGLKDFSFNRKYLPLGGLISGFFGGLSGHQGAMRSAFLIKCGLTKEVFISTGVVISCIVDIARISVYATAMPEKIGNNKPILLAATLSAFAGALIGRQLLKKVTIRAVQYTVSAMLLIIAIGLGAGII